MAQEMQVLSVVLLVRLPGLHGFALLGNVGICKVWIQAVPRRLSLNHNHPHISFSNLVALLLG